MKILLGEEAKSFLKELAMKNYINDNKNIRGGVFEETGIYVGYDCSSSETFVEEFDNIIEAVKYASGIMARTINNNYI